MSSKKIKPSPISTDKRKASQNDYLQFLVDLDAKSKNKLFGKGAKALANRSAFAGQSSHFMDHKVQDKALKDMKSSLASLHVLVPDTTKSYLDKHLMGKFGKNWQVTGVDKKPSKYTATLKHAKTGQHHQVDFSFSKYENGEPSHFSKWQHASHMTDRGYHIPQSARHLLLTSLTAAKGYGPGYVKTGGKYEHHDNVEKHSFSMKEGLKLKHVPHGNHTFEGLPVYTRATNQDPITDVTKILHNLVGKRPKVGEVKNSEHFHGVAKFAAANLSAGEKRKVAHKFAKLLATKKFHKDETKDTYQRKLIHNHFSTHFGDHMVKESTINTIKKIRT